MMHIILFIYCSLYMLINSFSFILLFITTITTITTLTTLNIMIFIVYSSSFFYLILIGLSYLSYIKQHLFNN